jgi:hypothetical protein
MREAAVIGPSTAALVEQILHANPHPEHGFRACLGILRLVRAWGTERVEAACQHGVDAGARSYSSIASIRHNNLDGRWHNAMAERCGEFVYSWLRRCPPDRANRSAASTSFTAPPQHQG